jgi:ribose transport system substrate-binding protein
MSTFIPKGKWRRLGALFTAAAVLAAIFGSSSSAHTVASSGPTAASASASGVSAAKAAFKAYEKIPTTLGLDLSKLKTAPPKGKTIVYLDGGSPEEQAVTDGVENAAKAVGWTAKILPVKETDTSTLTTALRSALAYKPAAVVVEAFSDTIWGAVIPAYKAAKIPIITIDAGFTPASSTLIAQIGNFSTESGEALADWFVSASKGKGEALLVNVPAFPILADVGTAFAGTVKKYSSQDKIVDFNATVQEQDSNTVTPLVVSDLKKNPGVKYLVSTDGLIDAGIVPALKAAGVTGIESVDSFSTLQNEEDVRAGTEVGYVPQNFEFLGWQAVDAAARHLEGLKVSVNDGGDGPTMFATKATPLAPSASTPIPAHFESEFKALWHL